MIIVKKKSPATKTENFEVLVRKSSEMLPILEKELALKLREKQTLDNKIENINKQIVAIKRFLGVSGITEQVKRGRKRINNIEKDVDGFKPATGKLLMDLIFETLKEHGPLHNKEILKYLNEKGYKVAGSNPVTNYFSHLSRDKRVTGTGKRGEYMVKEDNAQEQQEESKQDDIADAI